jgi:hypothetical protein
VSRSQEATREAIRFVLSNAEPSVLLAFGEFVREFNRRERMVRSGEVRSFDAYYSDGHYQHRNEYGTGFVVDGKPVPYFHPNRSFHDEIIWLNKNLFYRRDVSFTDKLANAAVVKFYGPSSTLEMATRGTNDSYISFERYAADAQYAWKVLSNVEDAVVGGARIWGTTELRTSLQTASRNHAIANPSEVDRRPTESGVPPPSSRQKMRPSDMVHWVASLASGWSSFFATKPTMRQAFEFLTSVRGIGNYYGYHFASNLSRMPGVGAANVIMAEHAERFQKLGIDHGNLDEDADYVVAGPGAMATLRELFPRLSVNPKTSTDLILKLRDSQLTVLGIVGDDEHERNMRESTELGRYTTFGCEIACCQFNVFRRAAEIKSVALQRAAAPISKEAGGSGPKTAESDVFG